MSRVYGVLQGVLESICMSGARGKQGESWLRKALRARVIHVLQTQTLACARSAAIAS
jgi:hypothetical protein